MISIRSGRASAFAGKNRVVCSPPIDYLLVTRRKTMNMIANLQTDITPDGP
ncbi:6-O-methylguanine DNA methyltransferase, partial [Rhizobium ruizarguesonis]